MGIANKLVGQCADMHESVSVNPDIYKGAERGHVPCNAGQFYSHLQIRDFADALSEGKKFKLLARITAGLREFHHYDWISVKAGMTGNGVLGLFTKP